MALKDIDLKSVESYKKAMKSEALKISQGDARTKFWIYKDLELPTEGGKRQKLAPFVVVNDDKGIKTLLKGKTLLCRGFCGVNDGKVSFEPEQGKIPYKSLKMALPGLMGKQLAIPAGVNSDEDGDSAAIAEGEAAATIETAASATPQNGATAQSTPVQTAAAESAPAKETGAGQSGATAAASVAADAVMAAWKKLQPEIQLKSAGNAGVKAGAEKAHQQIDDLLKGGKADAAKQVLDNFTRALNSVAVPSPNAGSGQPASGKSVADLTAEWAKLVPRVKASGNAALIQTAGETGKRIQEFVSHGKLAEAQAAIDQLTNTLDNLKPAAETTAATAGHLTPADITGAWQKLVPELKKKSAEHPELTDAAMKARKQLEDLTKAGKLDAAQAVIDQLAALVARTGGAAEHQASEERESEEEETSVPKDKQQLEYERKFAQMDPGIQRALKEQRGDTSQIRAAMALAVERAEGGDYNSALKVLSSLETLLAAADSMEDQAPTHELVEYRKKLLAFETAKQKAMAQVDKLSAAIPQTLPAEREVAKELAEDLQQQLEDIDDLIDEAIKAAKNQQEPITAALKSQIQNKVKELNANPLILHAEKNPFDVAIDIRNILGNALDAILQSLPVAV
jgi:hypothetical protein